MTGADFMTGLFCSDHLTHAIFRWTHFYGRFVEANLSILSDHLGIWPFYTVSFIFIFFFHSQSDINLFLFSVCLCMWESIYAPTSCALCLEVL